MQRGVLFGRRDFLKQRSAVAVLQALIGGQASPAFFGFAGPAFEVGGLDRARPSGEGC